MNDGPRSGANGSDASLGGAGARFVVDQMLHEEFDHPHRGRDAVLLLAKLLSDIS